METTGKLLKPRFIVVSSGFPFFGKPLKLTKFRLMYKSPVKDSAITNAPALCQKSSLFRKCSTVKMIDIDRRVLYFICCKIQFIIFLALSSTFIVINSLDFIFTGSA